MTNEEAIKILTHEKDEDVFISEYRNRIHEAIQMAIDALRNTDAISRTRAMETFAHWAEHKDYTHVERHILHAVVDELWAMPSISEQPDEWTPILKDLYNGLEEGS